MTELRIAEFEEGDDWHYVVYLTPAPAEGPVWMAFDPADGWVAVGRDASGERWRGVRAAVTAGDGEPLEDWITLLSPSALDLAEKLGWLVRFGPVSGEVLAPASLVWFPRGLPAGLREQAGGDIHRALRILADCVREKKAEALPEFAEPPVWGTVVTAAELAAVE